MTTAEAQRKMAKALECYEQALNIAMEVMRDRYPAEVRDRAAWSISQQIYTGHHGLRTLRLRVEGEGKA